MFLQYMSSDPRPVQSLHVSDLNRYPTQFSEVATFMSVETSVPASMVSIQLVLWYYVLFPCYLAEYWDRHPSCLLYKLLVTDCLLSRRSSCYQFSWPLCCISWWYCSKVCWMHGVEADRLNWSLESLHAHVHLKWSTPTACMCMWVRVCPVKVLDSGIHI